MDSLQLAIVAEIARRNGDEEVAKRFDVKCEREIRREVEASRTWQRELHGKE